MAGPMPLQATAPNFPRGSGGGLGPIRDAILNLATLGEHDHPGSLAAYGHSVLESFNPTTPAGAFNLATIIVPGYRGSRGPTNEQANLLNAIRETSYGREPVNVGPAGIGPGLGSERKVTMRPQGPDNPKRTFSLFNLNDPKTWILAGHTGVPAPGPRPPRLPDQATAANPLTEILYNSGGQWGTFRGGTLSPRGYRNLWASMAQGEQPWLFPGGSNVLLRDMIINAIKRRN